MFALDNLGLNITKAPQLELLWTFIKIDRHCYALSMTAQQLLALSRQAVVSKLGMMQCLLVLSTYASVQKRLKNGAQPLACPMQSEQLRAVDMPAECRGGTRGVLNRNSIDLDPQP